jgi:hypothetical protein
MRGRVAVLLLSSLLAIDGFGQCNFTPVLSAQFRSSMLDVAVDGNDLWTATSYGVQLLDRTVDPPAVVATLAVPGITRVVRAANGIAYAGSGTTVQIIRKNGRALQLVRGIDTGGTVNDLLLTATNLYAATTNGLLQYDLLDPLNPTKTPTTFATSATSVRSLTLIGSTLYAADGDSSVETFSITVPALPQKGASITTLATASTVENNNGRLYITDANGQQTDIVSVSGSAAKLATIFAGASALAPVGGDVAFAAGRDRTLRALDFTTAASPIELFRTELAPTGGTINRILSLATANGRLYAAAGDLGLATYDVSTFTAPFPVRSYAIGGTTSVVSTGDRVYFGKTGTGISEYAQTASGALTSARSWDSRVDLVHDTTNGFLITSSGASLTMWTLLSSSPTAVSSVTFARTVTSAALVGVTAYALLSDGSFASADMSQLAPVAQPIAFGGATHALLARSGNALALAQVNTVGTTTVRYFPTPSFNDAAVTVVPGVATAMSLSGSTIAVFTFRGINIIDALASTTTVLPRSNAAIVRELLLDGTTLYALTDTSLAVWDTRTGTKTRELALPATGVALHAAPGSSIVDVATLDGITSVATKATSQLPVALSTAPGNSYYRKVAASSDRVYLLDARGVDIYTTSMHHTGSIATGGIIDVAAAPGAAYSLSSSGVVTLHGVDGNVIAQATINEGADAQPLAIAAVNGAVWVAVSKGCQSGGCETKTLVFDPRNNALVQTASLAGGVVDVTTNGARAYALVNLPSELHTFNVSDPFHPAQIAARGTEGERAPLSIAYANGTIYVLGEKLYAYDETSLSKTSEPLGAYVTDATGAVAYTDQQIRNDGNCAIVTGRTFAPQLVTLPSFAPSASFSTPAVTKSVARTPGRLYVLTDYSLDIWSTSPLPKPARHHVSK